MSSASPSSSSSFSPPDHYHHQQQQALIHSSDQLCYVHCNICDTVLAVSVPSSSLFKTVTVRCGHCTNLLSVNMRAVVHSPQPSSDHHHHHHPHIHLQPPSLLEEIISRGAQLPWINTMNMMDSINDNNYQVTAEQRREHHQIPIIVQNQQQKRVDEIYLSKHHTNLLAVNRPFPEKRQRVPSAYNRFIKEEIQRLKAGNPDISHREAFSAAAKNWAHFPHIHFGRLPEEQHQRQAVTKKPNLLPCQPLQEVDDVLSSSNGMFPEANLGVSPY